VRRLLKAGVSVNRGEGAVKAKRHGTKLGKIRLTTGPTCDSLNSVAEENEMDLMF